MLTVGIARDFHKKVFYKYLCASEGFIESLQDNELIIVVDHEQDDINHMVNKLKTGSYKDIFNNEKYKLIHDKNIEKLKEKSGEEIVNQTLSKKLSEHIPKIYRQLLSFWMNYYLLINYESYKDYAFEMKYIMLSKDQYKKYSDLLKDTLDIYIERYSVNKSPHREYYELTLIREYIK